jgi:hypothetical protein
LGALLLILQIVQDALSRHGRAGKHCPQETLDGEATKNPFTFEEDIYMLKNRKKR